MTGSSRLITDLNKLDHYKFETEKRKLQLSKTISLATLSPAEFAQFRETGVLRFFTTLEMFDRDFPGHYLRLIKRIRTSVIALVPPREGIHATLSTSGLLRVVVSDNERFRSVSVRRPPESVALTSPTNATGQFELPQQPGEMMLPFEGHGVASTWEFCLPKAANHFDFATIVDVLVTYEHTALSSPSYAQLRIEELDNGFNGDRTFSLRRDFADQWYHLNNPEYADVPATVEFTTNRGDFPPNLEDLTMRHIVLFFVRAGDTSFEISITNLEFTAISDAASIGGGADFDQGDRQHTSRQCQRLVRYDG